MKTTLSDLFISFLDLLEAEGRSFRYAVIRIGWGVGLIVTGTFTGLLAIAFFLWGLHQYVSGWLGPAAAAVAISGAALVLTLASAAAARWITK